MGYIDPPKRREDRRKVAASLEGTKYTYDELFDAQQAASLMANHWIQTEFTCHCEDKESRKLRYWAPASAYVGGDEDLEPWLSDEKEDNIDQQMSWTCEAWIRGEDNSDELHVCGYYNQHTTRECASCGNIYQDKELEVERRMLAMLQTCDPNQTTFKQLVARQKLFQGDEKYAMQISNREYREEVEHQLWQSRQGMQDDKAPAHPASFQMASGLEKETYPQAALDALTGVERHRAWLRGRSFDSGDAEHLEHDAEDEEQINTIEEYDTRISSLEPFLDKCMRLKKKRRIEDSRKADLTESKKNENDGVVDEKVPVVASKQPIRAGTIWSLIQPLEKPKTAESVKSLSKVQRYEMHKESERELKKSRKSEMELLALQRANQIRRATWHWQNTGGLNHAQTFGLVVPVGDSGSKDGQPGDGQPGGSPTTLKLKRGSKASQRTKEKVQNSVSKTPRLSEGTGLESEQPTQLSNPMSSAFTRVRPLHSEAQRSSQEEERPMLVRPSPFKDVAFWLPYDSKKAEKEEWKKLWSRLPLGVVNTLEAAQELGYPQDVIQSTVQRILSMQDEWRSKNP